jgi:hypothetical protein
LPGEKASFCFDFARLGLFSSTRLILFKDTVAPHALYWPESDMVGLHEFKERWYTELTLPLF